MYCWQIFALGIHSKVVLYPYGQVLKYIYQSNWSPDLQLPSQNIHLILKNVRIPSQTYRFKRFKVINQLTHYKWNNSHILIRLSYICFDLKINIIGFYFNEHLKLHHRTQMCLRKGISSSKVTVFNFCPAFMLIRINSIFCMLTIP